jgi:S-ribosylhomocysteine lyase LuxS involved in autoinducer biosynthesis
MSFEEQVEEAVKVAKSMMINIYNDENIPVAYAKYCGNFHRALKKEGFTNDEAIQIMVNLKFPESKKD